MPKRPAGLRLYEVRLERGRSNAEHGHFCDGVMKFDHSTPDYAGIQNVVVISTALDPVTLKANIAETMADDADLEVVEITKETLATDRHAHYREDIRRRFLQFGDYPAI